MRPFWKSHKDQLLSNLSTLDEPLIKAFLPEMGRLRYCQFSYGLWEIHRKLWLKKREIPNKLVRARIKMAQKALRTAEFLILIVPFWGKDINCKSYRPDKLPRLVFLKMFELFRFSDLFRMFLFFIHLFIKDCWWTVTFRLKFFEFAVRHHCQAFSQEAGSQQKTIYIHD